MSNKIDKPKQSPSDLVSMLSEKKGITFNYISKSDAVQYLSTHNNYLRTASYRKNYDKHLGGPDSGKYINLDFAYLVELSKLDMYLRSYLLQLCIDVEHALKVSIVSDISANPSEDGYSIVDRFFQSNPIVLDNIAKKSESVFTGDLIAKYFSLCTVFDNSGSIKTGILNVDCPVWVLVEILSFNDFLNFIFYYNALYPNRLSLNRKRLNTVRSLRNACAHNNCILFSLCPRQTQPHYTVSQYVSNIPTIQKEERKNKLSCRPLYEIACLLMEYSTLVSEPLRGNRLSQLKKFAHGRLVSHIGFFDGNDRVKTSIIFLQKLVDYLI